MGPGGRDGMTRSHTICLIPGDGIGPEVSEATRTILEAGGLKADWIVLEAGAAAAEKHGHPLPPATIEAIQEHRLALKGPLTTPVGKGFASLNMQLRKRFNLYAALRPVRSLPGVKTRFEGVDVVVVRENTEGLYSGLEHEVVPGVVESLKIATRVACERIACFAFDYAHDRGRKKVSVFHKANILKQSDGLFLECARRLHQSMAPDLEYEELIIDNGCMQLVRDPSRFDVLLMENLYGDVVSDLCAGLVGGLGVVPGANIGDDCAIFEAVHGSAPDIAGQGVANPLALLMSGVMMLHHVGETEVARRVKAAYDTVLQAGDPATRTRDIGGTATTRQFTEAVLRHL